MNRGKKPGSNQLALLDSGDEFTANFDQFGQAVRYNPEVKLPFYVQKHQATRLHYDFRLNWGGVLKSWAVPSGPSYNPEERREAIQVFDHSLHSGKFEGIIPPENNGAGTVMVWDQGVWAPHLDCYDVTRCLREGHIRFTLFGSKLKGNWRLLLIDPAFRKRKARWQLIKEQDAFAYTDTARSITEDKPHSIVTGRSLDQITWKNLGLKKQCRQEQSSRHEERALFLLK